MECEIKLRIQVGLIISLQIFLLCFCKTWAQSDDDDDAGRNSYAKCEPNSESLVRMGPNSKYFLAPDMSMKIRGVEEYCKGIGLQAAEIRNILELIAVENFMKENNLMDRTFSLGINDDKKEGLFVNSEGKPMEFHVFAEGQPSNDMNLESCVVVMKHPQFHRLVYMDTVCETEVTPMCMFRRSDECFFSSPLSLAEVPSGFSYVGSSSARDYYVGYRQLPRSSAEVACMKEGYSLVDFNTGLSNNQMMYEQLKKWMSAQALYPRIAFWTGGIIVDSEESRKGGVPQYQFQTSEKLLKDLSDWPSLQWDIYEPSDSSGIGLDRCISAILYLDYSPSGDNIFSLSTTNCRIPHYPLCYKDKISMPNTDLNDTMEGRSENKPVIGRKYCPLDNIELDLDLPGLSAEELWNLALISRINALGSDEFRFKYATERAWLSNFIDVMIRTARKVAPEDILPLEFSNIIHNMVILYYNAVDDDIVNPSPEDEAEILAQTEFLQSCMEKVFPLKFQTVGGLPRMLGDTELGIPPEAIDGATQSLDLIIDSYWSYFLTTVGICYPKAKPSRTQWLLKIHHVFVKYFMKPFLIRWPSAPSVNIKTDYGVFMGDLNLEDTFATLRILPFAAFVNSSIGPLYFPRPLYIRAPGSITFKLNTLL